jgi:hypothetical protein
MLIHTTRMSDLYRSYRCSRNFSKRFQRCLRDKNNRFRDWNRLRIIHRTTIREQIEESDQSDQWDIERSINNSREHTVTSRFSFLLHSDRSSRKNFSSSNVRLYRLIFFECLKTNEEKNINLNTRRFNVMKSSSVELQWRVLLRHREQNHLSHLHECMPDRTRRICLSDRIIQIEKYFTVKRVQSSIWFRQTQYQCAWSEDHSTSLSTVSFFINQTKDQDLYEQHFRLLETQ